MAHEAMAKTMGSMEEKIDRKKFKPVVSIGVSVTTDESRAPGQNSYREDEKKRLHAEIGALEKELKAFNVEEAAEKVKKGLETKLELKKLRLRECELKLTGGMNDY
jgi:hypothetical protein